MTFNWQQVDWPTFNYSNNAIEDKILAFTEQVGRISGMMKALSDDVEIEVLTSALVAEAVKTSAIEGELISREDVMSSVRNNLGLNANSETVKDKRASGVVKMMLDVRESFAQPLSESKLFEWHRMLMEGNHYVKAGQWRSSKDPMQVISGAVGREKVHFEAPPSSRVPAEMKDFIEWFNETAPDGKNPIQYAPSRSALVHLYFESIHPFEDGNGRIGRAISEKVLSQNIGRPLILSLSQVIESDRKAYYEALKKAQRSTDVTDWVKYFADVIIHAQKHAEKEVEFVLLKARFFDLHQNKMNERQKKVINRMFAEGPSGFEGGMNARKYISITRASKATATRDLQQLSAIGALKPKGEGRSRSYFLNF